MSKHGDLKAVLPFVVDSEAKVIRAYLKTGSIVAVASELGVPAAYVRNVLSEAKRKAARRGWSPAHDMTKSVPDGFHVKGVSTYYKADKETGELKAGGQWVKSQIDQSHKLELLLDAAQKIAEPLKGLSTRVLRPTQRDKDLLCVYPMGDPHVGMLAWHRETGKSFDLETAERELVTAVDQLVDLAPPAKQALVINLGDFFHTDNASNRTTRSGNMLDVDGRWPKVMAVGIRTMRRVIDRALEKHETVRVICEIGNHDDHAAIVLALVLENFYANNTRVEIDTSPSPFHWHRFGKNLIGVTHGDSVKITDLPEIMAQDRAKDWGETEFRRWYTGHVHHDQTKELRGCVVESFRTLAPNDAWAHRMGYRSGQDMKVDVLHREYGLERRHIVGIKRVLGALKK